ncbi:MAG: flagellin [Bdellovibrionota bacterium]
MGLRIKTNVVSLTAQRLLDANNADMSASMEKLSSGSRINKSADDAAGLAISESLKAKTGGLVQAKRNANDGISLIQTAEGALNETSNMLVRMRELTVQAASDTVGVTERGYLNKEYQELVQEIDRISESTEFNGRKLLGPQSDDNAVSLQVGYNGTQNDVLKLKLGDAPNGINADSLNLKESSIAGEDREKIAAQLDVLDVGLTTVANTRASLGATQSRLNTAISNISTSTENMMSAKSRIHDVDYAEETAKLTQSRILTQAGLSILSQANQKPEMALSLLR